MADTKSGSRAGSKLNLNESTMPLLDDDAAHEKAETPEKDAIEMKEKASTTSEPEKDDSNPEKTDEGEKTVEGDKKKNKKEKKEKKKKEKAEKAAADKAEKAEKAASTSCHRRTQSCVQTFTVGLNVLDRDEKHINDTVNLNFEDVLAEPDVAHGFDPIWRTAFILFTGSRYWIYRLLSSLLALPLALIWGITFSLLTFFTVWFATPILRILDVVLFYVRRVWVAVIKTTLEPVTNAIGGCFSNVKVAHTNQLQTV